MARQSNKVYARRDVGYSGRQMDRGQIFELVGARNDDKLVSFGYVAPVERGTEVFQCSRCGAEFVGMGERLSHIQFRHPDRELSPAEEDEAVEARERMLMDAAPLTLPGPQASNI